MVITKETKILKVLFLVLVTALFVAESKADQDIFESSDDSDRRSFTRKGKYSNPSTENQSVPGNVFYDHYNKRELMVNPQGQVIPKDSGDDSYATRYSTFHEEYKPTYDPKTQRVKSPIQNKFVGGDINTHSTTVKPPWYDRMTTYNENQRRPWNPYAGGEQKVIANVYYDSKEAAEFGQHYMQPGLKAVPYMYGSASLVMRKELNSDEFTLSEDTNLDHIVNPDSVGRSGDDIDFVSSYNPSLAPLGGYGSISDRNRMNQLKRDSKGVIVTDPESMNYLYEPYNNQAINNISGPYDVSEGYTFHSNVMIGKPKGNNVQAVTKIDVPRKAWNEKPKESPNFSRPGDFDYKRAEAPTVEAYSTTRSATFRNPQSGMMIENGNGYDDAYAYGNRNNNGNFNDYSNGNVIINPQQSGSQGREFFIVNGRNQAQGADNYTVETGDTLSEISEKEKIYGNWTLWPLIYDANRNQLDDPDLIEIGQNLDIPRNYTESEESDANYRAKMREHPISLFDGR
ncbi:MAG: LysM peptidoglycan-binding domain-containing protein [Proteobacteria bacterium]|nr:LysM peptidoglycan-binding domain-containing protein [Pseudomonadota bacterium]